MNRLVLNGFSFFPTQPYAFTANIVAALRKKSIQVDCYDANLDIWLHILSSEYLSKREYRPEIFRKYPHELAPFVSAKEFDRIKRSVVAEIDYALKIFRTRELFNDISKLNWANYVILKAQRLIYYQFGAFIGQKAIFWPEIGFKIKSMNTIYALSEDKERNPLIEIMMEIVIPKIKKYSPSLIGIEMTFPWEIIQVLTLNKLIRKHIPNVHINFLGQGFDEVSFARLRDKLKEKKNFYFGFDSIFLNRNESEIIKLYEGDGLIEEKLSQVETIAFQSGSEFVVKGPFVDGKVSYDIVPDYTDADFDLYLSPERVIIDRLSTRCFWGKCNYCSINAYKDKQQISDVDLFVDRIMTYRSKYNCRYLWLLDEATPPRIVEQLADKLLEKRVDVIWSVRTRIDKRYTRSLLEKMHQAGCREMWIGLEAASTKMLRIMNKTDDPENYNAIASNLMKNCSEIGLGIHYCVLMGVPGETEEDRKKLVEFFKDNQKHTRNVPFFSTFNEFWLMKDSRIHDHPEEFGIRNVISGDNDNYDMVDVPFEYVSDLENKARNTKKRLYSASIENTSEQLVSILVKNKPLLWLWFCVTDSPFELLMKDQYQNGNPFQDAIRLREAALFGMLIKLGNKPGFSSVLDRSIRKSYAGVELPA